MVFGTFDVLHPGHKYFLEQAKKLGDELVVVVARNSTVLSVKANQPLNSEEQRVENLVKLNIASRVILGREGDKLAVVVDEQPDVIALGYDQTHFVEALTNKFGDTIQIIRIDSFRPEVFKSSKLKKKIE